MATGDSPRKKFGFMLRNHRIKAGLTQQELAALAVLSQSTVSTLENGGKGTKRDHVARLDKALTTNGALLNAWDSLFTPHGMIDYFHEVAEAEQVATEIREYALGLIPGLAQTEGYIRAISRLGMPYATNEEIESLVTGRTNRQKILERPHPPILIVLLDESCLLRSYSEPSVMYGQLSRLLDLSLRPRVTIQIIPLDEDDHPGLEGSFKLLGLPEGEGFAYIEGRGVGLSIKEPRAVQSYERVFGELRSAALPVAATRARLEEIRGKIR